MSSRSPYSMTDKLRSSRIASRIFATRVADVLACLSFAVGCGWASIAIGQDINPDTLNYHMYDGWAVFHNSQLSGVFPSGAQTLLNPLIDVPFYVLRAHAAPEIAAFVMGFWEGLAPALVYLIARQLTRSRFLCIVVGLGAAVSGGFASELGSQLDDSNVAPILLLGVLLVVLAVKKLVFSEAWTEQTKDRVPSSRDRVVRQASLLFFLAGIAVGIGSGLKLADISIGVAVVLSVVVIRGRWPSRVWRLLLTAVGSAVGLVAVSADWSVFLWQKFGDPFAFTDGPFLFFKSPYYPNAPTIGAYAPPPLSSFLTFPISMYLHPLRVSEIPIRDASISIAYVLAVALFVLVAVQWLSRILRSPAQHSKKRRYDQASKEIADAIFVREVDRYLIAVFVLTLVVWLKEFAYYRYLIPDELLAPVVILAVGQRASERFRLHLERSTRRRWAAASVFSGVTALCMISANPSSYWVRIPFAAHQFVTVTPATLLNHRLNLVVELPSPNPEGVVLTLLKSRFLAIGSFGWEDNPPTEKLLRVAFQSVRHSGGNIVGYWTGESLLKNWSSYVSGLAGKPYREAKCITEPLSFGTFTEPAGFCEFVPSSR